MRTSASVGFRLSQGIEDAVESVCESLRNRGWRIVGKLDISRYLEESAGIRLAPCRIVLVVPQLAGFGSEPLLSRSTAVLPLHVVISENGCYSEIYLQNRAAAESPAATSVGDCPEIRMRLFNAVESVAARSSALA